MCFTTLGKPYHELADRSRRDNVTIPDSEEHRKLVKRLHQVSYITSYECTGSIKEYDRKLRSSACTTVAALWISGSKAIAAHVGDSRIYQFRDGKIIYQSEDHSMVQVAISPGQLPSDVCRHHKDRNKVYNILGDENERPNLCCR